jgi:hypothetical protein
MLPRQLYLRKPPGERYQGRHHDEVDRTEPSLQGEKLPRGAHPIFAIAGSGWVTRVVD